jgi:hypothetical protein
MSGLKMRVLLCAAVVSTVAAAHAAPASAVQRAASLDFTAVHGAVAVVEAPNPFSHKWHTRSPR